MRRLLVACALVLGATSSSAQSRWTLIHSETLTIIGDQSPRTLGRVASDIEQFREVVGQLIGTARPPALPTIVYAFGTQRSMRPYAPAGRGQILAGFYLADADMQRIVVSLDQPGESPVAFHEYMHLILDNAVRGVPAWLGEGLAEYFSSYRLMVGGRVAEAGGERPDHMTLLREGYLPIAELLGGQPSSTTAGESEHLTAFYAHAWALTHYILTEVPNAGAAINNFVARVRAGQPAPDAFRVAFGSTPSRFDVKLRQYIRREIFPIRRYVLPDAVNVDGAAPPRPLTTAEVDAWLGDLLRAVHGEAAAASVIEAAAASGPEAAITQLALGRLRLTQNRVEEGLAALGRAAILAPEDFLMQLAHGGWLVRRGGTAKTVEQAALLALQRAVALNPESAEPHARIATLQARSAATLDDARDSLRRAIDLAPGRLEYSLRLADLYLRVDDLLPARAILTAVIAGTSDPRLARAATRQLNRIAERERARATPAPAPRSSN